MSNENKSPISALQHVLLTDRGYLLSWHANLAVSTSDALDNTSLSGTQRWEIGQDAARRFISTLFAGKENRPATVSDEEVRTGRIAQASSA